MTTSTSAGGHKERPRRRTANRSGHRPGSGLEGTVAIIDRLLITPVQTTLKGENVTLTALEAIVLQLLQKSMAGDTRAHRVLLKYQALASQSGQKRLQITFVENDYTRSVANWQTENSGD
jgi:hypothetical protein